MRLSERHVESYLQLLEKRAPWHIGQLREHIAELIRERDEARLKPNQRTWDLLRFCRSELHEKELITDGEYALLAEDHPAVNRLGDYDFMKMERDEARAKITESAAMMHASLTQARAETILAEAAIAAAFREAEHLDPDHDLPDVSVDFETGYHIAQSDYKKAIHALTPATAIHAEKLLVAQARLEEAGFADHEDSCLSFNSDYTPTGLECSCRKGKRITNLTAALEAIRKEKVDADV